MTREEWVKTAEAKLVLYLEDAAHEYAEELYKIYVEDDPESAWHPEAAVCEDMSYWGE